MAQSASGGTPLLPYSGKKFLEAGNREKPAYAAAHDATLLALSVIRSGFRVNLAKFLQGAASISDRAQGDFAYWWAPARRG
jgi:hypothetical protein